MKDTAISFSDINATNIFSDETVLMHSHQTTNTCIPNGITESRQDVLDVYPLGDANFFDSGGGLYCRDVHKVTLKMLCVYWSCK